MRVAKWSKPSRELTKHEVDIFYDRPLHIPTLFSFKTRKFEVPSVSGAYSLKLVTSGVEEYEVDKRTIRLQPNQLLFVNAGQKYSSRIATETQSVSIFLPEPDRVSILQSLVLTHEESLDQKQCPAVINEVPQIPFSPDDATSAVMSKLLGLVSNKKHEDTLEATRLLMVLAMGRLLKTAPVSALNQYTKRSTRDEIISRLLRAKSVIDDTYGQVSDLDHLSQTACLSKYYFLRLFGDVFGQTPSNYARRLRVLKALKAIENGEHRSKAARTAGYDNLRSFRRACVRYTKDIH